MGQLWSIFFPKRSHSHQKISSKTRERNRFHFGSNTSLGRSGDDGSVQEPMEYHRTGPISSKELEALYGSYTRQNGGKRTRKHTRNSNSTLKRSTLKQKRA